MRTPLTFFVVGLPKGQPRAKACRFGNVSRVYDPGTADEWKMFVRDAANKAWDKVPWTGPLCVNITIYFPRPKAHFTKKGLRPDAPKFHTSKPDRDNCDKAVLDALTNLGLWKDDSQVATGTIKKLYQIQTNTSAGMTGAYVEIKEAE